MPVGDRYYTRRQAPVVATLSLPEDIVIRLRTFAEEYGDDVNYVLGFAYLLSVTSGVGDGNAKDKAGLSIWDYETADRLAVILGNGFPADRFLRKLLRDLVETYWGQVGDRFGAEFGKQLRENRERTNAMNRARRKGMQ